MAEIVNIKLNELVPDTENANSHTLRGMGLLEKSVDKYGPSRDAMILDRNLNIVGGNARAETFAAKNLETVQVIRGLDPNRPVALQYDDLDLYDPENPARALSIALNRVAAVNIEFDYLVLGEHAINGVELSDFFLESELQQGVEEEGTKLLEEESAIEKAREIVLFFPPDGRDFEFAIETLEKVCISEGLDSVSSAVLWLLREWSGE